MRQKRISAFVVLFCIGGCAYNLIEILWRGYSHWSMFFVGGGCFHLIGKIGNRLKKKGILAVSSACSLAITAVEYVSGCVVNLHWKLNVWDYSQMFANLNGQVCLLYSLLRGLLSVPADPLYSYF
jgi:uncharacterized membrane protein